MRSISVLSDAIQAYNAARPRHPWPVGDEAQIWEAPDPLSWGGPSAEGLGPEAFGLLEAVLDLLVTDPLPYRDDEWDAQGGPGPGQAAGEQQRAVERQLRERALKAWAPLLARASRPAKPRAELIEHIDRQQQDKEPWDRVSNVDLGLSEGEVSLAYRTLERALNGGVFDQAFPILAPYLAPTDQTLDRSLVRSRIARIKVSNGHASKIKTDLVAFTDPAILGDLWLTALLAKDGVAYQALGPYRDWPLPVVDQRNRLHESDRCNMDDRLRELLAGDTLAPRLEAALLNACKDLEEVGQRERLARAVGPLTQQPGWFKWVLSTGQDARLASLYAKAALGSNDLPRFQQMLNEMGPGRYVAHRRKFLEEVLQRLAVPTAYRDQDLAEPEDRRRMRPFAERRPWLDAVLDHVDLDHLPGLAERILEQALHDHHDQAAYLFPRFWPGVDPTHQGWNRSLLQRLVVIGRGYEVDLGGFDLAAHSPPELVGWVLLRDLAAGVQLSPHLGDLTRWPLPLDTFWPYLSRPGSEIKPDALERMRQGWERALDNPDHPEDLRQRLYEACRPLRPLIAEERFRSEERHHGLTRRPAESGRRPRTRV